MRVTVPVPELQLIAVLTAALAVIEVGSVTSTVSELRHPEFKSVTVKVYVPAELTIGVSVVEPLSIVPSEVVHK